MNYKTMTGTTAWDYNFDLSAGSSVLSISDRGILWASFSHSTFGVVFTTGQSTPHDLLGSDSPPVTTATATSLGD